MTKFSWRLESSLPTSGSQKIYSCLVLTEPLNRLSRPLIGFRRSVIGLTQSERVLTSMSSFLAHRLAYSSHASMIILNFWCHENETGPLYFGPLRKRSLSFRLRTILRSPLTKYGHMERIEIQNHSNNKMRDSGKDKEKLSRGHGEDRESWTLGMTC